MAALVAGILRLLKGNIRLLSSSLPAAEEETRARLVGSCSADNDNDGDICLFILVCSGGSQLGAAYGMMMLSSATSEERARFASMPENQVSVGVGDADLCRFTDLLSKKKIRISIWMEGFAIYLTFSFCRHLEAGKKRIR